MNQEKIGKFIAESRKKKNLTQEQLAELLGVNNRTVSRWETGRTMPDISLYKPLCKLLGISVEELVNGEKTKNKDLKESFEKAIISTIDSSQYTKNKLSKLIKLLLIVIIIMFIIGILIVRYFENKYPKFDIYNISVLNSEVNQLNNKLTLDKGKYKIWFYGIDSLQLSDSSNNYFDLRNALRYKQVSIGDVKEYLDYQYQNGNMERYVMYDGGTKIYKGNKYEAIICNTVDGNRDIYFGTSNIASNLNGAYCGHEGSDTCYFTRTYYILNINDDNDNNYINITLKSFQGEIAMIRINRIDNIQVGKNYEFVFSTYEVFDDNISNIFKNSTLIKVEETNKVGLEQINEKICVNSD